MGEVTKVKNRSKKMHDYAINMNHRRIATVACLAFALLLSMAVDMVAPTVKQAGRDLLVKLNWSGVVDDWRFRAFAHLMGYLSPISEFGLVCLLYDRVLWKMSLCRKLHRIPDLTGTWDVEVVAPLKQGRTVIKMTIRQNWNKIHVNGVSSNGTETDSYTASIELKSSDAESLLDKLLTGFEADTVIFSYAYHTTSYRSERADAFGVMQKEKMQRYPGFNSLTYDAEKDVLEGEYFSDKNITLPENSAFMNYVSSIPDNARLLQYLKGCGSKGHIRMERISKKCE